MIRTLWLGLLMAAFAAPAAAQKVAPVLAQWGLLGTWAIDCNRPVASDNVYLSYAARSDGSAFHAREFVDRKDSSEIEMARILEDGTLEMRVRFTSLGQTREWAFARRPDGRLRVLWNREVGGAYSVRDSRLLSTGNELPWQTRCR